LEAGISLFAVLGFCYVPLGSHTGLEHAKAIFGTPAAKRAGAELIEAFAKVRGRLTGEVQDLATGAGTPALPALPAPHKGGSHAEHPHHAPGEQ
jgi:hypothetical protein